MFVAEGLKKEDNPRNASNILSACRSALEIAIKNIKVIKDDKEEVINFGGCKTLKDRIEYLRQCNLITREIYKWSDRIRVVGNEAVHEGKASIEDANECFEFVHLFCHIIFTLPSIIKQKNKGNSESPKTE
ncbi:DUF4145 domain-containing protein [Candidatus Liberibacter brunswickensis]